MSRLHFTKITIAFIASLAGVAGCIGESVSEPIDQTSEALPICLDPPCPLPNPNPTKPKPNLLPEQIDANAGFCFGTNGMLSVRIRNGGGASAGASTTLVDFGTGRFDVATPPLGAGSSFDFAVPIPTSCFHPDCRFSIIADENGNVTEANESDNLVSSGCVG